MVGTESTVSTGNVLLVEGQDDKHVVRHLCRRTQPMPTFCTLDKGNDDKLLSAIGPEIKVSGRRVLGIVVDADDDVTSRWNAVVDRVRSANIPTPNNPDPAGTIISSTPRIGIWLMPNNQLPGELEDFVQKMIPVKDPVWPMSKHYIQNIPPEERKFAHKVSKAELYAWLATRQIPGRMGSAIGMGDLLVDEELARMFANWLRRLFG